MQKTTCFVGILALVLCAAFTVTTLAGRSEQSRTVKTDGYPDPIQIEQWGLRIAPSVVSQHPDAPPSYLARKTRALAVAFAAEFDDPTLPESDVKWGQTWICRDHWQCAMVITCPPLYDPACDPSETGADEHGCYCQGY